MNKFLDKYYHYSIFFDALLCLIICVLLKMYEIKFGNIITYNHYDKSICSDLGSIGLTISGFLITISTILISFKSSAIYEGEKLDNDSNTFKIFIASPLYFTTVSFLNKFVLTLVIISILNYLLKILTTEEYNFLLFYTNICSTAIITVTFARCLYILNLIIKMQK